MKKIYTSLLLFFFFVALAPSVFALSSSQAGKILQNFKLQEKEMIFESDSNFLDEQDKGILSTYKKLNLYSTIGDKIQSKREYLEAQNEKIASRVNSLETSIAELDTDIAALGEEVNAINQQIVTVKEDIDTNKATIDILKKKIAENTEILLAYMVYLYKKGESVSSDQDIDNLKTILLSGEPIDKLVNDLYFKSIIQVTWQQLLEKHKKYVSTLYIEKIELEQSEAELKDLRKAGILEKNILDDKRAAKERILEITKGQEELYQKYISEKITAEKDVKVKELREKIKLNNTKKQLLEKYNCEFIDISQSETELGLLSQECLWINKIIYAESRLSGVALENNPLTWPVSPYLGMSSFFRDDEYRTQFGTDHDAIDIIAPQGTEIKAPMDGYVIYIQAPVNSGYAYIALKHTDGLVTLYGHVSEIQAELYDFVKEGEVFALSGGEYGTPGAWVLSTGPHVHMAVYENEEYVDPLEYLDLSYLPYTGLQEKYEYKYKSDFRSRKGFEYKVSNSSNTSTFRIEWENEVERQKYLLSTYAVGPFSDWDIWVEEALAWGIDPTFMMCVGLAETSLGKHLKSAYNIGNVGNNDRGDTKDFVNARSWVAAMTATFNNKYLSKYMTIDQLSRYGNKTGSIYASSEFNWHNNITKCMSHVKGQYIRDEYPFRVDVVQ